MVHPFAPRTPHRPGPAVCNIALAEYFLQVETDPAATFYVDFSTVNLVDDTLTWQPFKIAGQTIMALTMVRRPPTTLYLVVADSNSLSSALQLEHGAQYI